MLISGMSYRSRSVIFVRFAGIKCENCSSVQTMSLSSLVSPFLLLNVPVNIPVGSRNSFVGVRCASHCIV